MCVSVGDRPPTNPNRSRWATKLLLATPHSPRHAVCGTRGKRTLLCCKQYYVGRWLWVAVGSRSRYRRTSERSCVSTIGRLSHLHSRLLLYNSFARAGGIGRETSCFRSRDTLGYRRRLGAQRKVSYGKASLLRPRKILSSKFQINKKLGCT